MTSGFYRYSGLITVGSNYSKRMERLSARIFGEVARPVTPACMRVVKIMNERPADQNLELTNYYPRHKDIDILMDKLRSHGLYRDEHQDFQEEMERLRALRGKGDRKAGEDRKPKAKEITQ